MAKTKQEWYVIINPHAGSGKTMVDWIPAERYLKDLGVPFYTVFTTHKHHATELAATAARIGYRNIMAVGGDGSIHEVFNGIIGWCETSGVDPSEFRIAVAPIGSGNDWIKTCNVPNDIMKVMELIHDESFRKQDIVKVTSAGGKVAYMANIGGLGFDSHVCERVNRQKEHGKRSKMIYVEALIHTLIHAREIDITVFADEVQVFDGHCYSIALGTGKYSGGGMKQVCLADPSDGILDALIVPKIKVKTLLKEIPRIFQGTTDKSEEVKYIRCKNLRIVPHSPEFADIYELDGEIEGSLPLNIQVLEGKSINVLCGK